MKNIFLILILCMLSCANNKNINNDKYVEIFETQFYDNYVLSIGKQDQDTLAFLSEVNLLKNCKLSSKYISTKGLSTTSDIVTDKGDSLIFTYHTMDVNKKFIVTLGAGKPGQYNKKYIYTYSNYPYIINDCNSLKNK